MLFTILPAALLALAASSGSPAIPHHPGDGMLELQRVVTPRVFWNASLEVPQHQPRQVRRTSPTGTRIASSKG